MIAISAALEGFFRFGERWRHYRPIVERLKIEGWQFFQLSGPYAQPGGHGAAYPAFAAQVEAIIQSDVETYVSEIVREKQRPPFAGRCRRAADRSFREAARLVSPFM